jgi:ribosomal protein S18 acetylase RimI-like enzyme
VLVSLAPHHRAKLAELLAKTPEFTAPEVDVALELIDVTLANPGSDDYRFIVCEEGDDVLGYACFGSTPMTEGCFDLYWLAVRAEGRRTGTGRELLAAVEKSLRDTGGRLIRVETAGLDSYKSARLFYERCGYREAACIDDFYWPGNHLYIYTKYLASQPARD